MWKFIVDRCLKLSLFTNAGIDFLYQLILLLYKFFSSERVAIVIIMSIYILALLDTSLSSDLILLVIVSRYNGLS